MGTVHDLLDEYKHFLGVNHPEHSNSFHQRCNNQPEAARAEAVVFSFFEWNGYDIRVEETESEGGVDFRVQTENTDFVVEVTSILRDTFAKRYGAPERPISGKGYSVNLYGVARQIRHEAFDKAKQMSGYDCPTILVIACEYPEYAYILRDKGAFGPKMLLTSPPKIAVPSDNSVTYLEDSLFFRFQNDTIVFCRKSISVVLLFYISKYYVKTAGLLHPKPAYNFSIELLPSVPFVEVLVPEIENYSVGDSYKIEARWTPDNLRDGLFEYN